MSAVEPEVRGRQGEYGLDGEFRLVPARAQAVVVAVIWLGLVAWTVRNAVAGAVTGAVLTGLLAVALALFTGCLLRTTRVGKFEVWTRILDELGLRGDERLLDLGCGRGAILHLAAGRLPAGRAAGIDLWVADQTGNSIDAARRNAELEGVAERVELHTGDLRRLPFADAGFDVVISNLAVHNIPTVAGRLAAVDEAVRVLRPNGKLAIVDPLSTGRYAARLRAAGLTGVRRRNVGWRMWWGSPLLPSHLVTGTKTG